MSGISLPPIFFAAFMAFSMLAAPVHAQATRTWVSGVGDDVNPCSRTAPCKTFAGAISKTAVNGEINCLDPGGFGTVTITKSITIDCNETFGSILNSGTNGINIPFNSFGAGDTRKTVRLRNLSFNGANPAVESESKSLVDGNHYWRGFDRKLPGRREFRRLGARHHRRAHRRWRIVLYANTTVRNTGATGIVINPGAGTAAGQRIDATLHNVRVQNSNFGISIGSAARVMINSSVFSGNTQAGIEVETSFSPRGSKCR